MEVNVPINSAGVTADQQAALVAALESLGDVLKGIAALGNTPTSRGAVQLVMAALDDAVDVELQAIQLPATLFPKREAPRAN